MANHVRARLTNSGRSVELRFVRRDQYGTVVDRFQITVPRRSIEIALRDASIEAPWRDFFKR